MTKEKEIPEVIDNLRRIFQVINEYSRSAEKTTGLTGPQLWALKILVRNAPMRLSELAKGMYLSPATVVGIIDRLEAKGLVTRTRSSKDRRAVDIELTDEGENMMTKAPEVAQILLLQGLESLPDEQFSRVVDGMKLLVMMLGADKMTPLPLHG